MKDTGNCFFLYIYICVYIYIHKQYLCEYMAPFVNASPTAARCALTGGGGNYTNHENTCFWFVLPHVFWLYCFELYLRRFRSNRFSAHGYETLFGFKPTKEGNKSRIVWQFGEVQDVFNSSSINWNKGVAKRIIDFPRIRDNARTP